MSASSDSAGAQLELTTQQPAKHMPTRKASSSKKFKIESVAVSDDPLYKQNGASAGVPSPLPHRKLSKGTTIDEPCSPTDEEACTSFSTHTRVEPEGSGGEAQFQSAEDLSQSKPRSYSQDQKFYSVEDLTDRDKPLTQAVKESSNQHQSAAVVSASSIDETDKFPHEEPVARDIPGRAFRTRRRAGDARLRIDDSFCERATVEMKVDGQDVPDPEAVTDIFVPVPSGTANAEGTLHETITSAYETNISINKLLRERHKGSLAAMGRFFGNKQREIEKQRSTMSLLPAVEGSKKKKRCCKPRPVHFCLLFTFVLITASTVATLVTMQSSRDHESAISGYHFDYNKRELVVYDYTDPSVMLSHTDTVIFMAHMGVHIAPGVPFNCTDPSSADTIPHEIACYKWYKKSTLRLASRKLDSHTLCLDVEWKTEHFDPMLEDCIDLTDTYGDWYGGHLKAEMFPLGYDDINHTSYLPGQVFGTMAERFWISTKGTAVVAKHDFPLHIRVKGGKSKRLCLSSWYGYRQGSKKLSYSICRSNTTKHVHEIVMKEFYHANTRKQLESSILSSPIYTVSGNIAEKLAQIVNNTLAYSYILQAGGNVLNGYLTNQSQSPDYSLNVSPYLPFSDSLNLTSTMWIKSIDMNIPRLFHWKGSPCLLLNSSDEAAQGVLDGLLQENFNDTLIHVIDITTGDINGQEFYEIVETSATFQPYIQNFITTVSNSTKGPVMSSVVSALQSSSTIVHLDATEEISEMIRQVLQASLMGYNLINPGEISGSLPINQIIRTLQVAIFMPVVHFSESFLDLLSSDSKLKEYYEQWRLSRADLRIVETITDHVAKNSTHPLYSALWYYDEESNENKLSDQFIFNDQYLVAPILNASSPTRIISLPRGVWIKRELQKIKSDRQVPSDIAYVGPRILELTAALDEMFVFQHIASVGSRQNQRSSL